MPGCQKLGIELGPITKYTIDFLQKIKIINPRKAIKIEVHLLAQYNIKANKVKKIGAILSSMQVDYLKNKYEKHLKQRSIKKEYSLPVIKANHQDYSYEVDSFQDQPMALPCFRCNYLYSDLRVTWISQSNSVLETPSYEIHCPMCGFSRRLDLSGQINNTLEVIDY